MLIRSIRRALQPQNLLVTSLIGLVVASVAVAASVGAAQLKRNAVTTPKIRNNAVTSPKLRNQAVTTTKLKNNAVTTTKLRNGSVTAAKLKNGAVTGPKLRDKSITGAKIQEQTLGKVPAAVTADQAASVTGLLPVSARMSATDRTSAANRNAAFDGVPSTLLGTRGPITIHAKCVVYTDSYARPQTAGRIFYSTTVDGVMHSGDYTYAAGSTGTDASLVSPATPEADRALSEVETWYSTTNATHRAELLEGEYSTFSIASPDGTRIVGMLTASAKYGTLHGGRDGAHGPGNVCNFWGFLQG